jgi:hypothetical protein
MISRLVLRLRDPSLARHSVSTTQAHTLPPAESNYAAISTVFVPDHRHVDVHDVIEEIAVGVSGKERFVIMHRIVEPSSCLLFLLAVTRPRS